MKFTLESPQGNNVFSNYGDGFLTINDNRHHSSVLIFPDRIVPDWPVQNVADLQIGHFDIFRERKPDVVILGTGARQQFPETSLRRELLSIPLPIEIMDSAAACRTYNLLVSEGRDVGAAVMVI